MIFNVKPCADVIVSAAARREILVGGGAPPVPKNQRRRQQFCLKISERNSFYSQNLNFLFSLCSHRKFNKISTQQQWHRRHADKLSARRQKVAAAVPIIGGGGAARPAHGSTSMILIANRIRLNLILPINQSKFI